MKTLKKRKKYNLSEKPFSKDNSNYENEIRTYICPLGLPLYRVRECEYKDKSRIAHWTKECKFCLYNSIAQKTNDIKRLAIMEILPKSECNGKWKQTGHKKSTKNGQKQQNYHLHT